MSQEKHVCASVLLTRMNNEKAPLCCGEFSFQKCSCRQYILPCRFVEKKKKKKKKCHFVTARLSFPKCEIALAISSRQKTTCVCAVEANENT